MAMHYLNKPAAVFVGLVTTSVALFTIVVTNRWMQNLENRSTLSAQGASANLSPTITPTPTATTPTPTPKRKR